MDLSREGELRKHSNAYKCWTRIVISNENAAVVIGTGLIWL